MNKYLLLRDNKQSGPYTVPEIIEKGIKPYDLVWLEGKSAAWRYPSEIEELKAYSPVVEEQPFDRFYKKPEAAIPETEREHSRFEPRPAEVRMPTPAVTTGIPSSGKISKKVYINFPGASNKPAGVAAAVVMTGSPEKIIATNTPTTNEAAIVNAASYSAPEAETMFAPAPGITSMAVRKSSDSKLFYGVIAACFILVMLVGVLIINYSRQRNNIDNLSALVQQMEQKEKQDLPPAQTAVNKNVTAPAPEEPILQMDIAAADLASGQVSNTRPAKRTAAEKPVILPVVNTDQSISAKEKKSADPASISDNKKDIGEAPPSENLYRLVSVKSNKFKTGLLGGISNLQMELTNNSPYELHKVVVEIKYLGPEKKVVRTQTVYFENVSPGGQSSVDVPKSNRGVTIDYTITDIKS